MNSPKPGTYDTPDDLLAEFFDDPADREDVKRLSERLAAEERGARLVELRERARASREAVAARMGVELQHVVDLEAGTIGFDLHRIEEITHTGPDEADDELHEVVRYLVDLSSYIQAIGADITLEISGGTVEVFDPETGTTTTSTGPFFLPAPAEYFTPDLLYTVLKRKPAQLKIWAEVEGWRTDIAA
ncbi:helix-turn-helix domain-containing protein [Streptomyces diastaticus]